MRKSLLVLFFFTIILSNVSSLCEEGQIDINNAPAEELEQLSGIGPVKAQAIVDSRPFGSIDELIDVVGIGEVTLANIKQQELACVEDEEEKNEEKEQEEEEIKEEEKVEEISAEEPIEIPTKEEVKLITLSANTQNIKSENSKQLDKSKLPIYGLVTFCLLLVTLFMLKKSRYKKNEFR
jgi:competence ComEA-like helix-hairpin-helix protein